MPTCPGVTQIMRGQTAVEPGSADGAFPAALDVTAILPLAVDIDANRLDLAIPIGRRLPAKDWPLAVASRASAATARGGNVASRRLPVLVRQKMTRAPRRSTSFQSSSIASESRAPVLTRKISNGRKCGAAAASSNSNSSGNRYWVRPSGALGDFEVRVVAPAALGGVQHDRTNRGYNTAQDGPWATPPASPRC